MCINTTIKLSYLYSTTFIDGQLYFCESISINLNRDLIAGARTFTIRLTVQSREVIRERFASSQDYN